MIDDYEKTEMLINNLKEHLPIIAYPTKTFLLSMRNSNKMIEDTQKLEISDVLYMGDEGGIMCAITFGTEMVVTSLTHLNIQESHPLFQEIEAYKTKRVKKLKKFHSQNPQPKRPKKKKKKR